MQEALLILQAVLPDIVEIRDNLDNRENCDIHAIYTAIEDIILKTEKAPTNDLQLYSLQVYANICIQLSDFTKAIRILRYYISQSRSAKLYKNRMRAYELLANCYSKVSNPLLSLNCYVRMLELAWFVESKEVELAAYDQIGMQYYYLGNVEKAKYFHEKMMQAEIEPLDSKLRQLSKIKKSSMMREQRKKLLLQVITLILIILRARMTWNSPRNQTKCA